MHHGEFLDPHLVAVYDAEYGWGPDDDFFRAVVGEVPGSRVVDLGCGTGRLTLALAADGHTVTGVDPAPASLAAARAKPGADRVTWIGGTSAALPAGAFDTAVMTSHVAQFFVGDAEWAAVLADLARALVPGGRLTFDSRDPADRRWERWNPVDSRRRVTLPGGEVVTAWTEVTAVTAVTEAVIGEGDDPVVAFTHHYGFPDGVERRSSGRLRFRSAAGLRASLGVAGFDVERLVGGWRGQPVGDPGGDGEHVVVARRQPPG